MRPASVVLDSRSKLEREMWEATELSDFTRGNETQKGASP
jgi:hypothetical protein